MTGSIQSVGRSPSRACSHLSEKGSFQALRSSCTRRCIAGRKHVREAEARKANILVVEVRHVGIGKILAIDAKVHQNAR